MPFGVSALGLASLLGMVWRFGQNFLPLGKLVKTISNIAVFALLLIVAFSTVFSTVSLSWLTQYAILAFIVFVGLGYAAAGLIAELIGM